MAGNRASGKNGMAFEEVMPFLLHRAKSITGVWVGAAAPTQTRPAACGAQLILKSY
ncbi:MAG: hypothetical protein JOZ18_00245 [Chloroflexi bacterium]|nr:hypothetical protein [Chloroflexota bacterium]